MASGDTWRADYLVQEDYWMAMAALTAKRSRDPKTQVGALIVNQKNDIVAIGYNQMPKGCDDYVMPWKREGKDKWDTKYPYVCSAAAAAIMNTNGAVLKGCNIYVTLFPDNESAKLIIQAGITKVVYLSDQYRDMEMMAASKKFLEVAGIEFRQFQPREPTITIDLAVNN
ncbi:unnamed protein product [Gadus morhua 'NCC']